MNWVASSKMQPSCRRNARLDQREGPQMALERRTVQVFADWEGLGGPVLMGRLHSTPSRGKEVFSFEYEPAWLLRREAQRIDPKLDFFSGLQYPTSGHDNFGVFLDSCPDRWGRTLLQRREALVARELQRKARTLVELDYLLGVYDGHRLGALRFRCGEGPFLDDNSDLASPPWTSLRELEQASLQLEGENAESDPAYSKWLHLLIAPGRSLGGARPKASVKDPDGHLWIAKFPSREDTHDVGAWEGVLHTLARKAGIVVTDGLCRQFGSKHHTFLSRRFDRTNSKNRVHFASAMTMLERRDGEGASYLELAEVMSQQGAHPARDLEQLWRRIVFFVCVSNIDDHLRNHGFLLEKNGWSLSPAYDMNPVATGGGRALNISETDNAQDLDLVREVAESFRVNVKKRANEIISEVKRAVQTWRAEAEAAGLSRSEQARMASAFELADQ
jgi:serine/threonine-protein kinase HipA